MDIITYALLKKRIKELEEKVDNLGKFLGITTSQLTDGCSTNPIIIDNEYVTAKTGDWVIRYDTNKEFAFNGTIWQEFGDNSNVAKIYYDTKEGWNQKSSLIGEKEAFYIYTNYSHDEFGNDIPGMKIGDGNAYLIDLPFVDAVYAEHIANSIIHVTQEDRLVWDNNVTCFIAPNKDDRLVFRKRQN